MGQSNENEENGDLQGQSLTTGTPEQDDPQVKLKAEMVAVIMDVRDAALKLEKARETVDKVA